MKSAVLELRGIGKEYQLDRNGAKYATLRESVSQLAARQLRRRSSTESLWALKDITLAVSEGEAVGIIGRNGAGKTTLLRVVGGITEPTIGTGRVRGRVASLLEVGTGFHHELTGRENVYVSGALLGMTRKEIRRRLDEIVAFAELERFLDTPLKRYSAGMHVRLAFAVAAHLEGEILLVDEVLAVGDAEFQQKCLRRISTLEHEGRTTLFVSHDLGAIEALCDRAIWLDSGRIQADGAPADVADAYLRALRREGGLQRHRPGGTGAVRLESAVLKHLDGQVAEFPRRGEELLLELAFTTTKRLPGIDVGLQLFNMRRSRLLDENWSDVEPRRQVAEDPGDYLARVRVPPILPAGDYTVWISIVSRFEVYLEQEVLHFQLIPRTSDRLEATERERLVQPEFAWEVVARAPGDAPADGLWPGS